ncbi:hypothetical protein F2P56_028183 [Juglans regia]|uniref:Mediator complex subunit 15 KIX domain-containing protein n=1 Tax=Juglans regia TaxID=51240 RepID=A0A833UCX1_JUGRE|nr:hypothetical protein F2P56_028183 [Juglans regia]
MDTNNWRPTTGQGPVGGGIGGGREAGEPTMDAGDWRTGLPFDSRSRIVNKIMDTLKRHLPISGQEGLHELRKIATRFEEKIFTAATSQGDYLRKISIKMLTMEMKSQNPPANSLPSNSAGNGNRPPDLVMKTMALRMTSFITTHKTKCRKKQMVLHQLHRLTTQPETMDNSRHDT